jgi:hypothetical protein
MSIGEGIDITVGNNQDLSIDLDGDLYINGLIGYTGSINGLVFTNGILTGFA